MLFFQLRGIADLAVQARDWAFIERLWRDWSPGWELPAEELADVKRTLAQPGAKRAALAYYRTLLDQRSEAARETTRLLSEKIPVPTLALTGALDGCMDTRLHDLAMDKADFPAGLEVVRIEDAGHFLHQEKPEEVNRLLLDWLGRTSEASADGGGA
jgi:pimeloyl-ACP methyl ester carboxylesterase